MLMSSKKSMYAFPPHPNVPKKHKTSMQRATQCFRAMGKESTTSIPLFFAIRPRRCRANRLFGSTRRGISERSARILEGGALFLISDIMNGDNGDSGDSGSSGAASSARRFRAFSGSNSRRTLSYCHSQER